VKRNIVVVGALAGSSAPYFLNCSYNK